MPEGVPQVLKIVLKIARVCHRLGRVISRLSGQDPFRTTLGGTKSVTGQRRFARVRCLSFKESLGAGRNPQSKLGIQCGLPIIRKPPPAIQLNRLEEVPAAGWQASRKRRP